MSTVLKRLKHLLLFIEIGISWLLTLLLLPTWFLIAMQALNHFNQSHDKTAFIALLKLWSIPWVLIICLIYTIRAYRQKRLLLAAVWSTVAAVIMYVMFHVNI